MQGVLQRFIDQALVRGMLIDNDQTVLGLRDNVIGVDLSPRRAKRRRQQFLWNFGCSRPRVCGKRFGSIIQESLYRLGKAIAVSRRRWLRLERAIG